MSRVAVYRSRLLPISETFIQQQVSALRGWEAVLIGEERLDDGLDLAGMETRTPHGGPRARLTHWRYLMACLFRQPDGPLVRLLKDVNASLVHVHFGTDAVDVWPSVRKSGLPMLVTLHGYDINIHPRWWQAGRGGARRKRYPKLLLEMAQHPDVHFICVSRAIHKRAMDFGIPEAKLATCYIGVDTDRFRPGDIPITGRAKRVLFVGRLVEKKGTEFLIRAFARVLERVPDAELTIIGDGPQRNQLEALAAGLDVPALFLGAQDSQEVLRQMHTARLFCLPSVTAESGDAEGLPIVILEALAVGLPVVTSANGGKWEAVQDGENGYCVAERDIDTLSERLVALLVKDELTEAFSLGARSSAVRCFNLFERTSSLEDHYARVAGARGRS